MNELEAKIYLTKLGFANYSDHDCTCALGNDGEMYN